MEHSPLNKNRIHIRRGLIFIVALVFGSIALAVFWNLWFEQKTVTLRPAVRPAVQAVLKARFWSRVSGSYWDNEMLRQAKNVVCLPLEDRLSFYLAIILNCNLDTSPAIEFVELVGSDAEPLHAELVKFQNTIQFRSLDVLQRKAVQDWTSEMQVIVRQQGAERQK